MSAIQVERIHWRFWGRSRSSSRCGRWCSKTLSCWTRCCSRLDKATPPSCSSSPKTRRRLSGWWTNRQVWTKKNFKLSIKLIFFQFRWRRTETGCSCCGRFGWGCRCCPSEDHPGHAPRQAGHWQGTSSIFFLIFNNFFRITVEGFGFPGAPGGASVLCVREEREPGSQLPALAESRWLNYLSVDDSEGGGQVLYHHHPHSLTRFCVNLLTEFCV